MLRNFHVFHFLSLCFNLNGKANLYIFRILFSFKCPPSLRLLCVFRSLLCLLLLLLLWMLLLLLLLLWSFACCYSCCCCYWCLCGSSSVARAALVARAWATTSVYDNRLRTASTSSRRGHFNYKFMEERAANS